MNVITPEQSDKIGRDIARQVLSLDDIASSLAPPWGAIGKERVTRLARERALTYFTSGSTETT